jgi:hypothetical protein
MPEIHYPAVNPDFYVPLREAAALLSLSHREVKRRGRERPAGRRHG